jgi:TusA-related sulfurtransferase
MQQEPKYYLDITSDVCPMTFVRAKLYLERLAKGEILQIRLKGHEPLANVPKSILELGIYTVDIKAGEGLNDHADGVYILTVCKPL